MAKKTLTLAELVVNLTAKSASFNNELKRNKRNSRDWAAETRQHVNTAGKAFIGLGATASAGLAVIYKSASANIDALAKQSDRLGIATEDLGGLRHAAELTGVSQDKLDSSIERMVKRMGEAEMGLGASASMLKQYDLANEEFFNKKPIDQFAALSDKIAAMTSSQEQAAFAAAVFGREGVALVNTAKLGSDGIAELVQEADDLGITLSRVDAAKVEAANDAMTRAGSAFKGFSNSIAVEFAPLVNAMADMFTDATKNSGGFRDEVLSGLQSVTMGFAYVGNAIRGLEIAFKGAQYVVAAFTSETLAFVAQIANGWIELYNLITPDSMNIDPEKTVIGMLASEGRKATAALKTELKALALDDLPSQKIEKFFNSIREKSQKAAEEVAANTKKLSGSTAGNDDANPWLTAEKTTIDGLYNVEKALLNSYERQDLAAAEALAKRQESLFKAYEDELLTKEQYEEKSLQNTLKYEEEKEKITKARQQNHVAGTKTFFGDLATLSEHSNKTLSSIGKAAAKINIGISTAEAAMSAYKWAASWGGPIAGGIAASAAIAAGKMRLRQLDQDTVSDSGSSAGGLDGATTFDQGLPTAGVGPTEDSIARGAETRIYQTVEIKALDGASVQEVVNNNKAIFLQPALDKIEETGSLA